MNIIIITDDMEMGGLSKLVSYEAMGIRAVEAGIDILLVCQTKESQERIHSGLLTAVKAGKISVGRIDESVRRILQGKQAYHETLSKIVDAKAAETIVGSPAHREIMKNYGKTILR